MSDEEHGPEEPEPAAEDLSDGDLSPLERLRARHRADNEARRQEWLAEHAGDPDDPFSDDEMGGIIGTIDQPIYHLVRGGEDGTWLKLTYMPRPPLRLIDVAMGPTGSDDPAVSLAISDTEAYDLIARIIGAIGRQPDPEPRPVTNWDQANDDDQDDQDDDEG